MLLNMVSIIDNLIYIKSGPQKRPPTFFFSNISANNTNFKLKFYRPKGNSFLRKNSEFHQRMSNGLKVISVLVRPPALISTV